MPSMNDDLSRPLMKRRAGPRFQMGPVVFTMTFPEETFVSITYTPDGATAMWSMLARLPGMRRSWIATTPFDSIFASRAPTGRPGAPGFGALAALHEVGHCHETTDHGEKSHVPVVKVIPEDARSDHHEYDERDANWKFVPSRLAIFRSTTFVLALGGTAGSAEMNRLIEHPNLVNFLD
jgi:hypothetical protein